MQFNHLIQWKSGRKASVATKSRLRSGQSEGISVNNQVSDGQIHLPDLASPARSC